MIRSACLLLRQLPVAVRAPAAPPSRILAIRSLTTTRASAASLPPSLASSAPPSSSPTATTVATSSTPPAASPGSATAPTADTTSSAPTAASPSSAVTPTSATRPLRRGRRHQLYQEQLQQQQQQQQAARPKQRGPYFVARNFANNLAVYHRRKRGGNMKLTEVKKIQGDAVTLSQHLSAALELPQAEVTVNSRTNHVVIKGFHQGRVKTWLQEHGF